MYRSILVPLDGSPSAEFAVPVAQGIARRVSGGAVHLVRVHVPLSAADVVRSKTLPFYRDWEVEVEAQEREYLDALQRRFGDSTAAPVSCRLEEGPVVDTLVRAAEEEGAELIVMTTHGRGPLARAWLGSVADGVARRSSLPVLLVRPTVDPEPSGERLFRNILITLDGSELAEQVVDRATALGTLVEARYTLARVVSPLVLSGYAPTPEGMLTDASYGPELQVLIDDAEGYLEEVADRLRERGFTVETQAVVEMQPAPGILEYARERAADLIAIPAPDAGERHRQGPAGYHGADPAVPTAGLTGPLHRGGNGSGAVSGDELPRSRNSRIVGR
jgi:nucleotide-binding universal stress UspA family protein